MAKYKVKHTTILHNKKTYKEGSVIELTDEQAKRLEDFLVLIPEPKTPTAQNKSANKSKTAEPQKPVTPEGAANSEGNNGKEETTVDNENNGGANDKTV